MQIAYIKTACRVEDFVRLRSITGLSPRPRHLVEKGLGNSLFAVHATSGSNVVGMARIVGDGALNFDIVDVAVDPAYQGRGIGAAMMSMLMDYLTIHADEQSYITLMADVPELYLKFGFKFSAPATQGMYLPKHWKTIATNEARL